MAKQEFFRIFESALNGMIETRFMRDTDEVVFVILALVIVFVILVIVLVFVILALHVLDSIEH